MTSVPQGYAVNWLGDLCGGRIGVTHLSEYPQDFVAPDDTATSGMVVFEDRHGVVNSVKDLAELGELVRRSGFALSEEIRDSEVGTLSAAISLMLGIGSAVRLKFSMNIQRAAFQHDISLPVIADSVLTFFSTRMYSDGGEVLFRVDADLLSESAHLVEVDSVGSTERIRRINESNNE